MRTQSGATSLRALLYIDEIFGYLPPQRNPPSKQPLLRMLKSARAFGLGLLLATQNPVDVDYKALSNAGTWFIGKLQTEQDKNRLLDGLESASGVVPRNVFDKLISSLGKRVFVLHNIHAREPVLFQSRWAMNFLAGPLMRSQIPALNQLVGAFKLPQIDLGDTMPNQPLDATRLSSSLAETSAMASVSAPTIEPTTVMHNAPLPRSSLPRTTPADGSVTKPPIPAWIKEYYLPQNYSLPEAFSAAGQVMPAEVMMEGVIYRPTLLASAHVRILDRKLGVDSEIVRTVLAKEVEKRGTIRWEDHLYLGASLENVDTTPDPSARFGTIDTPLNDTKLMTALQKDFADWVYRSTTVKARANQALKVFAGPDISQAEFMRACADAAREARDAEIEKKKSALVCRIKALEEKLMRESRELREDEAELSHRKIEEAGTHFENLTGLFGGRRSARRLSSSLSKRRLTEQAKADVEESQDAIEDFRAQIADLEKQRQQIISEIQEKWGNVVSSASEVTVVPKKSDVFVSLFGVAWMPYYMIRTGDQLIEIPAFGAE